MSRISDYLLMRTAAINNDFKFENSDSTEDTQLSNRRLFLSLLGILLGIFLSFVISGLQKLPPNATNSTETSASTSSESGGIVITWPNKDEVLAILIVSLVICLLSYQGLYAALKVQKNEHAFLILCISFQYGFFWQSVIKGATIIL